MACVVRIDLGGYSFSSPPGQNPTRPTSSPPVESHSQVLQGEGFPIPLSLGRAIYREWLLRGILVV